MKIRQSVLAFVAAVVLAFPAFAVDIVPTPAAFAASGQALTSTGIAGATIAAGQLIYVDTGANNVLKLADCDASATTANVAGLALNGAATGQPVKYVISDPNLTVGWVAVAGTIYVASTTAGGMAPSADIVAASNCYPAVVALGKTASTVDFKIHFSGVKIP